VSTRFTALDCWLTHVGYYNFAPQILPRHLKPRPVPQTLEYRLTLLSPDGTIIATSLKLELLDYGPNRNNFFHEPGR
jgi:hypothetical protein